VPSACFHKNLLEEIGSVPRLNIIISILKEVSSMRLTTQLRWSSIVPALCILATATTLTAGGFYLSLEKPASADTPQTKDAVLLVRPHGCHQPEDALISATAEGFVKGHRETIKLQLHPASKGVYAIKQQWPTEGVWLVAVRGSYLGAHRSALLELAPNGKVEIEKVAVKDPHVKILLRELTATDIDARLRLLVRKRLPTSQQAAN
jgi:hypothetical protein